MNPVIGLLIILLCALFSFLWRVYKKEYDLIFWFFISYGFFIGFGLSITGLFIADNVGDGYIVNELASQYFYNAIIYLPITLMFLFSVCLGGYLFERSSFKNTNSLLKFMSSIGSDEKDIRFFFRVAAFMLLISFIAYYIYVLPYGGFVSYLSYSAILRSGLMDQLPPNPFSFLIAFGAYSMFSSYIFFALLQKKFSLVYFAFFLLSFVFSLYVLTSKLGRISFLFYFLLFVMTLTITKNLQPKFVKMLILMLLSALFLFLINTALGRGEFTSIFQLLSLELIFPFSSFNNVLHNSDSFRFGLDLVTFPVYLMPQSLWGSILTSADAANTYLLFGSYKGQGGNTTSIPIDILSLSFINFGAAGFIIFGMFTGYFLSYFDQLAKSIDLTELRRVIYILLIMNLSILTPIYADPSHLVIRMFPFICFIIIVYIFRKLNV